MKSFKSHLEEKLDKFGEPVRGTPSRASKFRKKELNWELRKEKPKSKYRKEEAELEERSTGDAIKVAIGKVVNKKNYKAALEYMKKSGKSPADVSRIYRSVDARELAKMAGM